ncbi:hypothetical protein LPC08_18370 [Roseomonas sp. OT10]|uniref:hypothetical protein n=1 Tax=Roseomonas cutis TaxID=2897332 RepID=UPI001E63C83B|nr:hypothetical protein [Roseomonas sp. OT10]UFN47961.1 hypothetical protein LPC08_18370 [Roseomonas sp. OT10]
MALSALVLCSRVLLRIGAQPVASFEEGTAEAEVAANLYPGTRDALLAAHPWSFATGQMVLPRLLDVPVDGTGAAFQLPANCLRILSAGTLRGRGLDYRIHEKRLHADTDRVVLTYLFRPDESAFPPHFAAALVARLAAEFCIPLTDSTARAEMLQRLAGSEFREARLTDSQQHTIQAIEGFPLIDVRG